MLSPKDFYQALTQRGASLFTGVPDSCLKAFAAYVMDHAPEDRHVITANEGQAIGLAAGHYLATSQMAVVYMQNSGLGNSVNPLTSLNDPDVYGLPCILVIGWRGEPGKKRDEPQHKRMGKVTTDVLEAIRIPWAQLPEDPAAMEGVLDKAFATALEEQRPYALVVSKGTFDSYKLQKKEATPYPMSRERAIELLVAALPQQTLVVSSTGKPSRELFEVREARGESHRTDFLTVGSMGHCSHIALGVALAHPKRPVLCIDGDGAVIMHLGGLGVIASMSPGNYKHLVLNNGAHDSVGGQPTVAYDIDLCTIAKASGYKTALQAVDEEQLARELPAFFAAEGPALLEVRVKKGARADLGRPTMTPDDLKREFMGAIADPT